MLETKPICKEEALTTPATAAATTLASENENTTMNYTTTAAHTASSDTTPADPPHCDQSAILNRTITELLKPEKMEEVLEEIVTNLSMKKVDLSAMKRKKVSAPDSRTSSTSMGYLSLSLLGVLFGLLILSDCPRLIQDTRSGMRTIWSMCDFS